MNRQPFRLKSPQWDAKLSPFWVRVTRFYRRRMQHVDQRLLEIDVLGLDHLRAATERNAGVLITPNHPGHADSYALYEAADQLGLPFYFMTAWQVFEMSSPIARWLYQRYGCFSIEREGADLWAYKRAVQILAKEANPLVIFPEGDVYHLNDRVTPLREGTAAIALSAMKQLERPVFIVPCGLKYRYIQDPTPELETVMSELESRLFWRPRVGLALADRVYKFAEAALALKELEYIGEAQPGRLVTRIRSLIEHVLTELERRHELKSPGQSVPERIKNVRRACLEKLAQCGDDSSRATAMNRELDDVFFVVQLYSYPGDYVSERPTVERLAETIDKFEEDVLGHRTARIRGTRRAIVQFGEPIDVRAFAAGAAQPRKLAGALTDKLEQAMQSLLDKTNGETSLPGVQIGVA